MSSAPKRPNQPSQHKKRGVIYSLTSLAVTLGLVALGYFYGRVALDMVLAAQYTPTSQLAAAEARIGFTVRGQQIFYATAPDIQDKNQFNTSCQSTERTAAILGCYYLDRIYLYNITDAELDGTLEVTAAHEMLHAAYSRLNYFERTRIDKLVAAQYQLVKDQPEIKQLMEYYTTAEPGAEADELHSIIGTTITDLSPELEHYYARYFTNRADVVALNAKYTAVFGQLTEQAAALQAQIDAEGPALKADLDSYEADLTQLNLDIASFNARAAIPGGFGQSEFAVARAALVQRTAALNARQTALNARVDAYNLLIEQLNSIAVHVDKLNQSINGVDAPSGVGE